MKTNLPAVLVVLFSLITLLLGYSAHAQEPPIPGLVAYYPFNGNAQDLSGEGNHGTVLGGTALAEDRFGTPESAFNFNGETSWIEATNPISSFTSFAFSVWIKPFFPAVDGTQGVISIPRSGDNGKGGGVRIGMFADGSGNFLNPAIIVPNQPLLSPYTYGAEWVHVVFGIEDGIASAYANGTLVRDLVISDSPPAPFEKLLIGKELNDLSALNHNGERLFRGMIDDVRVYERMLTENEVAQLYAHESAPPNPAPPIARILPSLTEPATGEMVTLDATAGGYPTDITYQWFNEDFMIPSFLGGTNPVYSFTADPSAEGTWRCVVTNSAGSSETSTMVVLFVDSDADGLSDYREDNITNTDKDLADTDSDGLSDFDEIETTGTNPNAADTDSDGLSDLEELTLPGAPTDPFDPDSDGDTLSDGDEIKIHMTDPLNSDSDGDGLRDDIEINIHGSSPILADSDRDGLDDFAELGLGTKILDSDSDDDGLTDGQEVLTYLTNPNLADTDADGFNDGFEVSTGFDPTLGSSTPDLIAEIQDAIEFKFNAANGVSYRIEATEDLSEPWVIIEADIIGLGAVVKRLYSIEDQPNRFFRVGRN